MSDAWAALGLEPTDDRRAVKRAYGVRLKQIDVEDNPEAFMALRDALETALSWGATIPEWELEPYPAEEGSFEEEADEPYLTATPNLPDIWNDAGGAWPPRPLLLTTERLNAFCCELESLLFEAECAEPERIAAVGLELIEECRHAPVDDASKVEAWLVAALAASVPRSDPLIEPAIRHFDWDRVAAGPDFALEYDLQTLMARLGDREALQRCLQSTGPDRAALEELMRSGRRRLGWFEFAVAANVRQFFNGTLAAYPQIEHDLAPDTLAWWRRYFAERHLPDSFWLQLLGIPPALTFVGAIVVAESNVDLPINLFAGLAMAVALTLGVILLVAELQARARRADERRDAWDDPSRAAIGWTIGAVALVPIAGALGVAGLWAAVVSSLAAAGIAIGVFLATPKPFSAPEGATMLGPASVSGVGIIAAATVLLAVPTATAVILAAPLATLGYVGHRAHASASLALNDTERGTARLVLAGIAGAAAAAIATLFAFLPALPPAAALAAIPAIVIAQHLATAFAWLDTGRLEWAVRIAAVLFHFAFSDQLFADRGDGLIAAILLYVLAYSGVRAVLALRHVQQPSPPPATL